MEVLYCIYYLVQHDINKQEDLLSREEHESQKYITLIWKRWLCFHYFLRL